MIGKDKKIPICVLNVTSFYYPQVPLAEKDRVETAFRSPTGFWEWTRMPYGLKGSPATFSRLMHKVLDHIPPS